MLDPYMLSNKILENIPYDDWILASEIASKIGKRSIDVACVIKKILLNKKVERKPSRKNKQTSPYLYRRLKILKLKRTRTRVKFNL